MSCLRGCILTLVAFVWLFSSVHFQMFSQIACPRKDIFTLVAFVYFNDIDSHFLRDFYTCTVQVVPFEAKSWFSISSIAIVCCSLPKRLLQSESNLSFNFGLKGKISHDILSLFYQHYSTVFSNVILIPWINTIFGAGIFCVNALYAFHLWHSARWRLGSSPGKPIFQSGPKVVEIDEIW